MAREFRFKLKRAERLPLILAGLQPGVQQVITPEPFQTVFPGAGFKARRNAVLGNRCKGNNTLETPSALAAWSFTFNLDRAP